MKTVDEAKNKWEYVKVLFTLDAEYIYGIYKDHEGTVYLTPDDLRASVYMVTEMERVIDGQASSHLHLKGYLHEPVVFGSTSFSLNKDLAIELTAFRKISGDDVLSSFTKIGIKPYQTWHAFLANAGSANFEIDFNVVHGAKTIECRWDPQITVED